jgi:hypothetical protein
MKTKITICFFVLFFFASISCEKQSIDRYSSLDSRVFLESFKNEAISHAHLFKNAVLSIGNMNNDVTLIDLVGPYFENQYSLMDNKYLKSYNDLKNHPFSPYQNIKISPQSLQSLNKFNAKSEDFTLEEIKEIIDIALSELDYSEFLGDALPDLSQNSLNILKALSSDLKTELADLVIEMSTIESIDYDKTLYFEERLITVVNDIGYKVASDKNIVGQERDLIQSGLLYCELSIPSFALFANLIDDYDVAKWKWLKNLVKGAVRATLIVVGGLTGFFAGVVATAWAGPTLGVVGGTVGGIAGMGAGDWLYNKLLGDW